MSGVTVTYKGTAISNLTTSGTSILKTGRKYNDSDITVSYEEPGGWLSMTGDGTVSSGFASNTRITSLHGGSLFTAKTGSSYFASCTNLETVTGFNNLEEISDRLFNNCTKLRSVDWFNSLDTLTEYAFYGCTALQSISGFNSLKRIGYQAFYNCTSLTTLANITGTIEIIDEQAFRSCKGLVTFDLPTNVTTLSRQIFYDCTNLKKLVIHGTVNNFNPGNSSNALAGNCTNLEEVELPGGSYGAYVLYNHKKFTKLTIGGPGNPVTSINANAFYGCNTVYPMYVYTEGAQEITHANNNYWGNNARGASITFIDSNGVEPSWTAYVT